MSTADRIKNNELKLQQEKVRKDMRKNFTWKRMVWHSLQLYTAPITVGH